MNSEELEFYRVSFEAHCKRNGLVFDFDFIRMDSGEFVCYKSETTQQIFVGWYMGFEAGYNLRDAEVQAALA